MKKIIVALCVVSGGLLSGYRASAQVNELAQLALNIEKLAQFRQILSDMKKGYEILNGGYNTIKNISKGNFELHKVFLDGLMEVSPAVRNYKRVADIVDYQLKLVREYKDAYRRFKETEWLNPDEIEYLGKVYGNLFNSSVKNLDDLFIVITSSKLRMSDDERLSAIDKIFADMQDKLLFLRHFNSSTSVLLLQRAKEKRETGNVQQYYNLK